MISYQQALTATRFEHASALNADSTRVRARRNGKTQTWKRQPEKFRIPVKHGLYVYFDITPANAHEWNVAD